MLPELNRIKGIHPGAILKRELKKRKIKSIDLANEIREHAQTINAITKERRNMNAKLSYKLGEYFDIPNNYFMIIQATYEVEKYKITQIRKTNPLIGKIRKSIFWDTKIELIDFEKNQRFIIQRILERGNKEEINHLIKIYSLQTIQEELHHIKDSFLPSFKENIEKFINRKSNGSTIT